MDDDFHRSEAKVLDGEKNLVRDVLVMLLALNHSLLGTHVQKLLPNHQAMYTLPIKYSELFNKLTRYILSTI